MGQRAERGVVAMSKDANHPATRRARRQESPNLPNHPSYIPGFAAIPLARFFVDLFVRPSLYNWLLVLRLFGVVALLLAVLVAVAFLQTSGISWWSLGAGAVVVALIALEYVCWQAARRLQKRR
jgi:hypothetical protein